MKSGFLHPPGVQLYTVRNQLGTEASGTLKAIAEVGYRQVELHDMTQADRLAPLLSDHGLQLVASHFWPAYITGHWEVLSTFGLPVPENQSFEFVIEQAVKHQVGTVVIPILFPPERGNANHYRFLAEQFNIYGEKCKEAGLQFCYHNHAFELEPMEGTTPLEILLQHTDPNLVTFELDAFWVTIAGADPIDILQSHPGRFTILHIKDLKADTPQTFSAIELSMKSPDVFQPIGQGVLDFPKILAAAQKSGTLHCIVELDFTPGPPLDALRSSFEFLQTLN